MRIKLLLWVILPLHILLFIGLVLWGLRLGIDFTDEGYYLSSLNSAQAYFNNITHFQDIIRFFFFPFMEFNIFNLRLINVLLLLIATTVFYFGFQLI